MQFVCCYLCGRSVHSLHWRQGFHQLDCQIRNRKALECISYPTSDTNCVRCGGILRVWTGDGTRARNFRCARFKKNSNDCPTRGRKTSTAEAQCHFCFRCDLDLCCIDQDEANQVKRSLSNASLESKDSSSSSSSSSMKSCPSYEDCIQEQTRM